MAIRAEVNALRFGYVADAAREKIYIPSVGGNANEDTQINNELVRHVERIVQDECPREGVRGVGGTAPQHWCARHR
jgi:hypothetical protein